MTEVLLAKAGKRQRVYVTLSDGRKFTVSAEAALKCHITQGGELSEEQITSILKEDAKLCATETAANYVAYSDRTKKQISDHLKRKGADEESIAHAMGKLEEYGYVNDEAYALRYARELSIKWGPHAIACKLRERGIPENIAEAVVEEVAVGQREAAKRVIEKLQSQYSGLPEEKKKNRIYAALMRKGFDWNEVSDLLKGEPPCNG